MQRVGLGRAHLRELGGVVELTELRVDLGRDVALKKALESGERVLPCLVVGRDEIDVLVALVGGVLPRGLVIRVVRPRGDEEVGVALLAGERRGRRVRADVDHLVLERHRHRGQHDVGEHVAGEEVDLVQLDVLTTIGAPTLRIRVKFSGSTMIFDSAAQTMPLNVSASRIWSLDVLFVIIALGGAGIGTGGGSGLFLYFGSLVTSLLGFEVPPAGGGFDSTVDNTIDVTAQWGTASASNVIQTTSAIIETLTSLKLAFPKVDPVRRKELATAQEKLEREGGI